MKPEKLALLSIAVAVGLHARIADAQEGIIEIYDRALENDPALREAEANYLATADARLSSAASTSK